MKKIFQLQQENKNSDRLVEAIKNDIRKYFKRERNKKLPEGALFWEFDCRFGQTSENALPVIVPALITELDKAHAEKWSECYVEILSKPSQKTRVSAKEESDPKGE